VQTSATLMSNGGRVAGLNGDEATMADVVNQGAGMRAWDLWRKQVAPF
jgi:hypothetical protein